MFAVSKRCLAVTFQTSKEWRPDSDPARQTVDGKNNQNQNLCVGFYKIAI